MHVPVQHYPTGLLKNDSSTRQARTQRAPNIVLSSGRYAPPWQTSSATCSATFKLRPLAEQLQSLNNSTMVFNESRTNTTSPRDISKYFSIWPLPPPGLYSPKDEVYASSFTLFMCDFS